MQLHNMIELTIRHYYGCAVGRGLVNFCKVLNGTMPRIDRREWACSFRLRQQLFLYKQSRNSLVFMNIPPNSKTKAVSQGGFADGMSKPIPYSFVQLNTIQRDIPESFHFGGGEPRALGNVFIGVC